MTWRRRDYHGSRAYATDESPIGTTALAIAWFVGGTKRRLGNLLAWIARPTPSEILMIDGDRHFSSLGTSTGPDQRGAGDRSFPGKSAAKLNDWRILP